MKRKLTDTHASVRCVDSDTFVEVDLRVLEPFMCRLYLQIKRDEPEICPTTCTPFWKCSMRKNMLLTFIRSLEHSQLSLGKDCSLEEALTTFEYEGVR
jgi:hypothetical protein